MVVFCFLLAVDKQMHYCTLTYVFAVANLWIDVLALVVGWFAMNAVM